MVMHRCRAAIVRAQTTCPSSWTASQRCCQTTALSRLSAGTLLPVYASVVAVPPTVAFILAVPCECRELAGWCPPFHIGCVLLGVIPSSVTIPFFPIPPDAVARTVVPRVFSLVIGRPVVTDFRELAVVSVIRPLTSVAGVPRA